MIENHGNICRAFVAFDRRGDGFVTLDELKRVLFNFAFPMSDKLFVELMDRYQNKTYNIEIHHLNLCHECSQDVLGMPRKTKMYKVFSSGFQLSVAKPITYPLDYHTQPISSC